MAELVKTCANCGNVQVSGEFCEKCGMRMPAAAASSSPPPASTSGPSETAAGAAAAGAAAAGSTPPPYAAPQYASAQQGQTGPQYGTTGSGPGGPSYGPGPQNYGYSGYSQKRGFFGRLFDFSFEEFITPSIIKILFIISIVVIGLGVLGGIIVGFMSGVGTGFFFLIGGLIGGFLWILYVRVLLELFIVFFRIHDNTEEIAKNSR